MQDRTPLYPGRVKLTPVSGQANVYDMVRADQPTQAGTPLNKATLLSDSTAALFGLGTDAVPDDVLAKARSLITTAQNTADSVNSKIEIATGRYTGTGSSKNISVPGYPYAVISIGHTAKNQEVCVGVGVRPAGSGIVIHGYDSGNATIDAYVVTFYDDYFKIGGKFNTTGYSYEYVAFYK